MKELRIGNWVENNADEYMQVAEIKNALPEDKNGYAIVDMLNSFCYCESLHLILLTPEILEAVGFSNQHGEGDMLWLHKDLMNDDALKYALSFLNVNDGGFDLRSKQGVKVESLHRLQNLFFYVSGGKELIYKPAPQPA